MFDKFCCQDLSQTSNEKKVVLAFPQNVIILSKNENTQKLE